jgi:signal transduction histidine kinase
LTTGLAHELGSPLQNLIGETEVALMSERDSEQYRAVLRSHLEELRDIGYAIGNLMTLCAIDATDKGAAAELERFDLGREAELRLRRERTHAERRGVQLAIEPHGDLEIEGDREALLLAVSNLVANAIDWSPPGGRVVCDISGVDGEVDVTVDDAGPGVPDDERQHIFEPFQRGRAAKGRRAGYGLGLAIAKRAVDAHGGGVSVERSPLGGARFRLSLPRKRAA